jgi:triphosphoribosyl-dephospho-CoA synthetase
MTSDRKDLARLLRLQRVMKTLREREHAEASRRVAEAERSIDDMNRMLSEESPVASLFPDLLARHFEQMLARKAEAAREAKEAAEELLKEKKRLDNIEEQHTRQRNFENRTREAKLHSELLDQRSLRPVSASSKIGGIR